MYYLSLLALSGCRNLFCQIKWKTCGTETPSWHFWKGKRRKTELTNMNNLRGSGVLVPWLGQTCQTFLRVFSRLLESVLCLPRAPNFTSTRVFLVCIVVLPEFHATWPSVLLIPHPTPRSGKSIISRGGGGREELARNHLREGCACWEKYDKNFRKS